MQILEAIWRSLINGPDRLDKPRIRNVTAQTERFVVLLSGLGFFIYFSIWTFIRNETSAEIVFSAI